MLTLKSKKLTVKTLKVTKLKVTNLKVTNLKVKNVSVTYHDSCMREVRSRFESDA
jgi:hypothetical protein